MTTYSIGFMRDDGDFQLVATLNNNDGLYSDDVFAGIAVTLCDTLRKCTLSNDGREFVALERQDAPDYVELEA